MPSPVPRHSTPGLANASSPTSGLASIGGGSQSPSKLTTDQMHASSPLQGAIHAHGSPSQASTASQRVTSGYLSVNSIPRGTKRTLAVEALAVRDALRMLDEVRETPSPKLAPAVSPLLAQRVAASSTASSGMDHLVSVKLEPVAEDVVCNLGSETQTSGEVGERDSKKRRIE
jgi:hypothetical protein